MSATVWLILMKFGMMMQIGPLQGTDGWYTKFLKNPDGSGRYLEKSQKSWYHRNGLTDLDEIWYASAKWVS